MHPDHAINRASWDELSAVHGQDAYYDSAALISGASSLIEEEESALRSAIGADLAGKRVLHLQCHLGFDAITFARRGASVTGVDFSTVALAKAQLLAQRCAVDITWVCADSIQLPAALHGRFDLVWATIGIVLWIADISAWFRQAATTLAPGGKLVLIDGYPDMTATSKFRLNANGTLRRVVDSGWDYGTPTRTGPQVQFRYPLAAIQAAAIDAGLRVNQLLTHMDASCDLCANQVLRDPDGRYRRRVDGVPQPVLFTLVAENCVA